MAHGMTGEGGRIDAHHHLWRLAARPQPWMDADGMDAVRRDFTIADLALVTSQAGIDRTIVVQTVTDEAETEELLDLAGHEPLIAGVIGWVDLSAPDVAEQLDRMIARSSGRWLVGVRSMAQYEPDPLWLARPDVLRGMRCVAERGLVHDLLIETPQIEAAITATRAVPEAQFVVDHVAKPDIAGGEWTVWAAGLATLAGCVNVSAKLSGLVTQARWPTWTVDDLRPYAHHVVAGFGPSRIMFGSDWPVCTVAATYDDIVTAAEALTAELSPEEQRGVFGDNARSVYRLDAPARHHEVTR